MDGIQRYNAPSHVPSLAATLLPPDPTAVKTPADYLRALRRRSWLVLLVAVPLSVLGTVYVLRLPAVYQAEANIYIEPPRYDSILEMTLSARGTPRDRDSNERYLPNKVALLKSKALAEKVINDPAFIQGGAPPTPEMADEFLRNLQTKTALNTNYVRVTLDGPDAARTAKQLFTLLDLFAKEISVETSAENDNSQGYVRQSLTKAQNELEQVDRRIAEMLSKAAFIGPAGKNVLQSQYENLGMVLLQKHARQAEAQHQLLSAKLFPHHEAPTPEEGARNGQIAELQVQQRRLEAQLRQYQRIVRNFDSDPSVRYTADKLSAVLQHIEQLRTLPKEASIDPAETIVATMNEEIHTAEQAMNEVLGRLRDSMPEHAKFLALQDEREQMIKRRYELQTKLSDLEMLASSQKPPVKIPPAVAEPASPIKPRRPLYIAFAVAMSLALGAGLVCLLEHMDHSVKVPEHLTMGLTLPLLGVVPRIRRTALVNRGGHLWTPGDPGSVEADAYRNLRASLLGTADRHGPIVTLLVTSAKAGEGKSTTALNLAATCARAGERTLLMDVDLRRPSLRDVFDDDRDEPTGLVDVLRGRLPWQRTVVRTDIPNLDFLPTGDTREIPIEILGTLELRQLLIGLAGHYDRVILDGPAVLGLADCRMLGRVVDAALLVVRSGTHEMRPLQRAKAMLEQSHVVIAGLVFNGLYDDLENWSSYGPYTPYAYASDLGRLGAPDEGRVALPIAG